MKNRSKDPQKKTMKAIVYKEYGAPDVLQLRDLPMPQPNDYQVLIKIICSSINSMDWDLLRGKPFLVRLVTGGISKPKNKILGCDVAGIVVEVGKKAKKFKVGDEVFGDISQDNWGAFAEFVCANENSMHRKPVSLNFKSAAALPQAGVMALQGIRDYGKVKKGQNVLINGAGGGVGSYAIQLAKHYGAIVTAVDSGEKATMMLSLGADHVIDYRKVDFTKNDEKYDFILDIIGHHSIYDYKRVLKLEGEYRMVGGQTKLILEALFIAPIISIFGRVKMGALGHKPNKSLGFLMELLASGQIETSIDSFCPLTGTAEALFGKLIINNQDLDKKN